MKRSIAIVALAVLLVSAAGASAQQSYKTALSYQIKAGLVSTYLTSNDYLDTGVGWGWTAGGGLFLPLFSARFGIQAEVMWVQKEAWLQLGTDADGNALNPPLQFDFTSQFVEVPIMAHWAFTANEDVRAYLLGGQAVSFNASSKMTWTDPDGLDREKDIELASYDWSPLIGIGVQSGGFLVEIRFAKGLKDQVENQNADPTPDDPNDPLVRLTDAKVTHTSFLIGFAF